MRTVARDRETQPVRGAVSQFVALMDLKTDKVHEPKAGQGRTCQDDHDGT